MSASYNPPSAPSDPGAVNSGSRRTFQVDMDAVIAQNAPSPMQQRALARSGANQASQDVLQSSFHSLTYEDVSPTEGDDSSHHHVLPMNGGPNSGAKAFFMSMVPRTTRGPGGQTYVYCGNPKRFWRCVMMMVAVTAVIFTVTHFSTKHVAARKNNNDGAAAGGDIVEVPPTPPQEPIIHDKPNPPIFLDDDEGKEEEDAQEPDDATPEEEEATAAEEDVEEEEAPTDDEEDAEEGEEEETDYYAVDDDGAAADDDEGYDDDGAADEDGYEEDDDAAGEDDEVDECSTFEATTQNVDPYLQCYCNDGAGFTNAWTQAVLETHSKIAASMPDVLPELTEGLMANSCHPQNMALFWMARDMTLNADESEVDFEDQARLVQRFILAYLYGNWGGDFWNYFEGWLEEGSNECDWGGIECNDVNQVTSISLGENNMYGPIPSQLGHLEGLITLELANNGLSGEIPDEFFLLTNLVKLDLNHNALSGDLPEDIALLTSLKTLAIKSNNFTGPIPTKWNGDAFQELLVLHMEDNDVEGNLPSELFGIQSLTSLSLSDNFGLQGEIPVEVDFLQQLEELSLHHMSLTGTLPGAIGLIKSLGRLRLDANQFRGTIPPIYGDLTALTYFAAEGNYLTGNIPTEFGFLSKMELMTLSGNEGMEGIIPTELARMTNLVSAHMSDLPNLRGSIPFCIEGFEPDFLVVDCSPQITCDCCTSQDNSDCDYS
uniref:Leucine-rich repeat-containing N-terminal plant-type domain-containing protein n=1 Tax=Grammatophora oceanica TaxID=210454 RepID=A0A7S1UTD1_9STRA|mmetsp:Transcript_21977/g.32748  ORF Transcript_21977/g.32748 Transcript_21977/m.32748 type:complete len:716 (+) Transcript_21977:491-2638(+)